MQIPSREQIVQERDALLLQIDTTSQVWKVLERLLHCDRSLFAHSVLFGSGDEKSLDVTRGKAKYAEELLNFPLAQQQAAKRNLKSA